MNKPYQAYAAATQTLASTRQIVLLYDGAIRCLQQAKEAMNEGRIEDRYHLLVKASSIIFGLQGCLDFEKGQDIAKVLYDFYALADMRILSLHRVQNLALCDQVINDLKRMRESWDAIDQQSSATSGGAVAKAGTADAATDAPEGKKPDSPGPVAITA